MVQVMSGLLVGEKFLFHIRIFIFSFIVTIVSDFKDLTFLK